MASGEILVVEGAAIYALASLGDIKILFRVTCALMESTCSRQGGQKGGVNNNGMKKAAPARAKTKMWFDNLLHTPEPGQSESHPKRCRCR